MESTAIDHSFEAEKNRKAFLYTACVIGPLLVIAFFYTWPLQIPPVPAVQDLIAINLGNEKEGMGTVQPMVKGERAPENRSVPASHERATKLTEEPARKVNADENNNDKEAAPVVKAAKPKDDAKDINKTSVDKLLKKINPSPVINPNPAPPKPKIALYKGGNGNGGNGATEDNGYKNQGYKPGNGDAGSPDGKPDAYGNSPGGKSGVSVVRGLSGRRPTHFPSMTDDFNENAKVFVDVQVDGSGKVVSASIARGTTTSSNSLRQSALDKARQLKFPPSQNDLENGTILFNFLLKS